VGANAALFKFGKSLAESPICDGIVYRKSQHKFVLSMEEERLPEQGLSEGLFSLVASVNEVTYNRQMDALKRLH